jgi:hypothetical protein
LAAGAEHKAKRDARRKAETQRLEAEALRRLVARTSGSTEFRRRFEVLRTLRGRINSFPYSVYFMLRPLQSRLVNSVWLWMPVEQDSLACSFGRFQVAYRACDAYMATMPWLSDWKSRAPDRTVEAHFLGDGIGENAQTLEREILPAWSLAGFQGRPEFKLRLRRNHRAVATLYLSGSDRRALVTQLEPDSLPSTSPLDTHRILMDPSRNSLEFAVVDSDGTFSVHRHQR